MIRIFVLLSALTVSACSNLKFNTNAGPYLSNKITSTFVKEYSPAEIRRYNGIILGVVTSSECQASPKEDKPSKKALNWALKKQVHDMGGNAIVIENCAVQQSAGCISFLECQGVAYTIPNPNSQASKTSHRESYSF
ncbi:hypothetical protein [Microbulbifer sp. TRSA005]|uniref:hypothetical protein n=1 Tax=unclassified Microbulbifer TaxID=2619833 RepID=UPI00403A54E9